MQPNNKKPKKTIKFSFYWMYAIILIFLIGMYYLDNNSMTKEVSFNEFEQYVQNGGVKKIIIYENKGIATGAVTDSLGEALFGKSLSIARALPRQLLPVYGIPISSKQA